MRCIEYTGHISNSGYGLDYDPTTQKTVLAHRLAFKVAFGFLPEVVMHTCDNPKCINPKHLKAGTQSDNIKDCVRKGRYTYRRKLSEDQVNSILQDSRPQRELARVFNVSQRTILNVKQGRYITGKGGSCGV
jgi:hypothetical protein